MSKNRYKMAVAAHLLLANDVNEILFLRRANTGYADGKWSVPAGHVDPGETVLAACIRETEEELAIILNEQQVHPVLVQQKHDTDGEERLDFFFRADLPPEQVPTIGEPDKCDGLIWQKATAPPTPLVGYVRSALAAIYGGRSAFVTYFGFDSL